MNACCKGWSVPSGFSSPSISRDAFAARLVRQVVAGADWRAVDQYGAGAANLDFAGNFGAIEIERVAQNFGEGIRRFAVDFDGSTVKLE